MSNYLTFLVRLPSIPLTLWRASFQGRDRDKLWTRYSEEVNERERGGSGGGCTSVFPAQVLIHSVDIDQVVLLCLQEL